MAKAKPKAKALSEVDFQGERVTTRDIMAAIEEVYGTPGDPPKDENGRTLVADVQAARRPDFTGGNLEGIDLSSLNLRSCVFKGCNLKGANFDGANLQGCNFEGADLTDASFEDADTRWSIGLPQA